MILGESTTLTKLLGDDLRSSILDFARSGKTIFGTCAGIIMLAGRLSVRDELVLPLESVSLIKFGT